jgi:hypothetical protein
LASFPFVPALGDNNTLAVLALADLADLAVFRVAPAVMVLAAMELAMDMEDLVMALATEAIPPREEDSGPE